MTNWNISEKDHSKAEFHNNLFERKPEKHPHRTIELEVLYELQISSKGVRCEC